MEQAPAKPSETSVKAGENFIYGLELKEQKLMKDWLERHKYAYTWSRTDKRTTTVLGTPDFTVTALRLALEFKQPGKYLSGAQEIWRACHLAKGGIYHVVYSFEEAKEIVINLTI